MEAIETSATLRFVRMSPQKARLVADLIRGRNVEEAKRILQFTQKRSAGVLLKLLDSAIANAEHNAKVDDPEILLVDKVTVDQGPVHRRHMHRARGRVDTRRCPTAHVTIVVKEDLKAKEEAAARAAAIEAKKAKKRAEKKKAAAPKKAPTPKKEAAQKENVEKKPAAKKKTATTAAAKPAAKKKPAAKPAAKKKVTAKPTAKKKGDK